MKIACRPCGDSLRAGHRRHSRRHLHRRYESVSMIGSRLGDLNISLGDLMPPELLPATWMGHRFTGVTDAIEAIAARLFTRAR
jgi:hypothetical protein